MKLISVIYVSNQARAQYPIAYVASTLGFVEEIHLLGGTSADVQWLHAMRDGHAQKDRMTVAAVDHEINNLADISGFMNKAVAYGRDKADFILLTQADECATEESAQLVRNFMIPEHTSAAAHLYCRTGFLYHDFLTGWGHSVVGSQFTGAFEADGQGGGGFIGGWDQSVVLPFHLQESDIEAHIRHGRLLGSLEIGSFTPELYYRHQLQNVRVWNEYNLMGPILAAYPSALADDPALAPYRRYVPEPSREEFIKRSMMRARHQVARRPLEPIEKNDARFTKVIDEMGVRADCEYVCDLVKQWGLDK